MDDSQHNTLKQQIQKRIKELEILLNDDEAKSATDEDAAVESQITENEKRELAALKNNLRWLDTDDAGYCSECGCEIPFARLQAVLVTRICINCAQRI